MTFENHLMQKFLLVCNACNSFDCAASGAKAVEFFFRDPETWCIFCHKKSESGLKYLIVECLPACIGIQWTRSSIRLSMRMSVGFKQTCDRWVLEITPGMGA